MAHDTQGTVNRQVHARKQADTPTQPVEHHACEHDQCKTAQSAVEPGPVLAQDEFIDQNLRHDGWGKRQHLGAEQQAEHQSQVAIQVTKRSREIGE